MFVLSLDHRHQEHHRHLITWTSKGYYIIYKIETSRRRRVVRKLLTKFILKRRETSLPTAPLCTSNLIRMNLINVRQCQNHTITAAAPRDRQYQRSVSPKMQYSNHSNAKLYFTHKPLPVLSF